MKEDEDTQKKVGKNNDVRSLEFSRDRSEWEKRGKWKNKEENYYEEG